MARPTKLTRALQGKICALIVDTGLHRKHVAARIGIDETTFSRWFHRGAAADHGDKSERIYRDFFLEVQNAEATWAQTRLQVVQSGEGKNPKLAAWALRSRFPELYGRKDNVEEKSPEDRNAQAQATRQLLIERLERLFPEPIVMPAAEQPKEEPAGGAAVAPNAE